MAEIVAREFDVDGVLNESYSRPQYSQIHRLIREGQLDRVKGLVEEDSRVTEFPDLMQKRSLHVACSVANSEQMVSFLLESGAKPTSLAIDSMTPLHIACSSNAGEKAVEMLVNHKEGKETIDWKNKNGKTALDFAFEKKLAATARVLCERGASITSTCCEAAAGYGHDGLKALVEQYGGETSDPHRVSPPPSKRQKSQAKDA